MRRWMPVRQVRIVQQGNGYRRYPLPREWSEPLTRLELTTGSAAAPAAPSLAPAIDELLGLLSERERQLLHFRWVQGDTLEQTGVHLGGITRERVRQLEARATKRFRANYALLARYEDWLAGRGLCVAALPNCRSRIWPQATGDDLWRFMVRALSAVTHQKFETQELQGGIWVLRNESCCTERLRALFEQDPRFRTVGEVARRLGVTANDLRLAEGFEPQLVHHQGGLLGWRRWNNADRLVALARYLADSGIRTWHFSQMAGALAQIWPERFEGITGRDVLGIVSRPGLDLFQNAGRNGVWQLREVGDGHRNNRDAVLALLAETGEPLALSEIMARLSRVARPATIQALLARDEAFRATPSGKYTVNGSVPALRS